MQLELFETFFFHFFRRRQPGSPFELLEPSLVILVLCPEFFEGGRRLLNLLGIWGHANPPLEVSYTVHRITCNGGPQSLRFTIIRTFNVTL